MSETPVNPCTHQNTRIVGDMPIADPETYEFYGRYDVLQCSDCLAVIEKFPVGTQIDANGEIL